MQYVFILPVLALGACVTPSKSLGAGESTGTDGDDTTASDPTLGDATDSVSGNTLTTSPGTDTEDPPEEEWCAAFTDEASCTDAPQMEVPGEERQFCRWTELHTFTIDGDMCTIEGPSSKCLTFENTGEDGCNPATCSLGPLLMSDPIARPIGDDAFEVWGFADVFCGTARVLGDWTRADDPSLAQCAMTCGTCGIPLVDYVESRSASSKDAPVDDCGWVTQQDSAADWQSAHDCVMEHMMAGAGFRVVADLVGIDSFPQEAFMGLQGESYGVTRFSADTGGIDPGTLFEQPAAGIGPIDDCIVGVGELCLAVYNAGDVQQICPA